MAFQPHPQVAKILAPLCMRVRLGQMIEHGALGLFWGSAASVLCGVLSLLVGGTFWLLVALAFFVATPIAFALRGFLQPCTLQQAAKAVDERFRLQDRAITALEAGEKNLSPAQQMQLKEALPRLQSLKVVAAAPRPRPQWWGASLLMVVISGLLFFFPAELLTGPRHFEPSAAGELPPRLAVRSPQEIGPSLELRPFQPNEPFATDPSLLQSRIAADYFTLPETPEAE